MQRHAVASAVRLRVLPSTVVAYLALLALCALASASFVAHHYLP